MRGQTLLTACLQVETEVSPGEARARVQATWSHPSIRPDRVLREAWRPGPMRDALVSTE